LLKLPARRFSVLLRLARSCKDRLEAGADRISNPLVPT
jgi:hypothetical protein